MKETNEFVTFRLVVKMGHLRTKRTLMKQLLTLLLLIGVINIVTSQSCDNEFSVPNELNRGRYQPEGFNYGNPYTMFNKRKPDWNLAVELFKIRSLIISQVDKNNKKAFGYASLYLKIYENALIDTFQECNDDQGRGCLRPGWARDNAIVHLIGLKYESVGTNDKDTFIYTPNPVHPGGKSFSDRANDGLRNLNPEIISCWGGDDCDVLKDKAFDLIYYLQAYDLLKTSGYFLEGDGDRNKDNCTARNKLREFSRNFYDESNRVINSNLGWKKNHGIICASALGMASIVLNDAGVETEWISGIFGIFKHGGFHIPRPKYSPVNWHLRADGSAEEKEAGIDDCMFHGKHWGATDVPQTNETGSAGYAEGPDYASYMMRALLPYMRTYANFLPQPNGKYLDDPRFTEIFKWYMSIMTPNQVCPTYDNSTGDGNIMGTLGMAEWPGGGRSAGDLLLSRGLDNPVSQDDQNQNATYINPASGNAILRTNTGRGMYYFQFLFETGVAVDKAANPFDEIHEDEDFGSFMLKVDNTWLAIDPPYLSSPFQKYTNKLKNHNFAAYTTDASIFEDANVLLKSNSNLTLSYNQIGDNILWTTKLGEISRNVKLFSTDSNLYYLLYDHFFNESATEDIKMAIHGNGNFDESSFKQTANSNLETDDANGRVFRWYHPCKDSTADKWSLLSHVALVDFGTPSITRSSLGTEHGLPGSITNNLGTKTEGEKTSDPFGRHTKVMITQPTSTALVQTVLYPYQCGAGLPLLSRDENSDYVTTLLRFNTPLDTAMKINGGGAHTPAWVVDSTRDFHFAKYSGGSFPVTNPFMVAGDAAVFTTDADKAFMSLSDFHFARVGGCAPSFIQFKQADIDEGTTLQYNDTVYIRSASTSTVHYKYAGKFTYEGYHYSTNSFTKVTFYLPDLQYGYQMQGKSGSTNIFTSHPYTMSTNDSFKYVTVGFPAGTTYFTIEVADPCAVDCYFPPTSVTIANTFLFNTRKTEVLGHDLDIVQGAGHLNITNASRMNICPDFVLVNKDSLVMGFECTRVRQWNENESGVRIEVPSDSLRYFCNRDDLLKDRAVNHTRNTIIVNNKAGLVLDSGSVTHIGTNSTILIRAGGTLLVKAGATVIIGDGSCESNRGELLADHNSYICIEEGAKMLFYNNIDSINFYHTDTLDRHIVYIAMPDGLGSGGAIAGKNPLGGRGKFTNAGDAGPGTWYSGSCVSFCDLVAKNPLYGVNNRPFGWFNVGLPRALYTSPDTLCIDKPFSIDGTPSLNETGYSIVICKYDTNSRTCINTIDSIVDNGDKCLAYRYLFTPRAFGYYRVRLIVRNDCNLTDTFTKIVYVPYLPVAAFAAPDSICEGIGVLHANGVLSRSNINKLVYRWTAEPFIDDSTDTSALKDANLTIQDWNIDSLTSVSSDFTFPGYMFSGGMRYLVSLMVKGWCTDSIYSMIVSVPLKVNINLEHAVSYENPVGPSPVRLIGTVLNAQSWSWSPTDYLDTATSLTPVTTPPEPITYVLTGTLNGCSLTDTVVIQHNIMTNAGKDRALCQGDFTILGPNFNGALFLGTYKYIGGDAFKDLYDSYYIDKGIPFRQYFTTFIIKKYADYPILSEFNDEQEFIEAVCSKKWFNTYYNTFLSYSANEQSLTVFKDSLAADTVLQSYLNLTWDIRSMADLLKDYEDYLSRERFEATDIIWEKQDTLGGPWVELAGWHDFMNIRVQSDSSQKYRMTLIDDDLGLVEYDEVLLSVDSAITPSFDELYQEDSTIYFVDETVPYNSYYSYLWVFGDGDSSTDQSPIHTFPAFDSAYRVCLNITNSCGTYQFCDTVVVDSIGLANGFNKTDPSQKPTIPERAAAKKQRMDINKEETTLDNVPNPFNGETIILYTFHSTFTKANLRITDVLGRTIKEIPLHSLQGKVPFEASSQSAGIYYVSLIADGVIVKSKTILIDR
jgi:hypothetical protein